MHLLSERQRLFAVIKHHTQPEVLARGVSQLSQAFEIIAADRSGGFDFDANDFTCRAFYDEIDFVFVTIMRERAAENRLIMAL